MIQIIGLREYVDSQGELHTADAFFEKNWRFESVPQLFSVCSQFVETLQENEKFNLFYTTAQCEEKKGRIFKYQEVIPFDLDYIDYSRIDEYIKIVSMFTHVPREKMGIVASGNGLQFIIALDEPIFEADYFKTHKKYYNAICVDIYKQCLIEGLRIKEVDTSVFKTTQLMRLPYTKNVKEKHGEKTCTLINSNIEPCGFDLIARSGLPEVLDHEHVSPEVMRNFRTPDKKAVLEGCEFIKWAKENQNDVTEPQWFALLSTIGVLEGGRELAHEYSRDYNGYSVARTDRKLDHALQSSNPRTCTNINSLWGGCSNCKFYGNKKSPITITSPETLKNRHVGFYHMVPTTTPGEFKIGKPNYSALLEDFNSSHNFVTNKQSGVISIYKSTHWGDITQLEVFSYCETKFDPSPTSSMCSEFLSKLQRNNLVDAKFFSTQGKINLRNGVIDYTSSQFGAHSARYGFKYVLPFDYEPTAQCPVFDKFISDVTGGDRGMQDVLMEFIGATIAYAPSDKVQKALVLTGDGSNGKSTFVSILRELVGKDNISTLNMGGEISKMENRYMLDGKLCNISEETPNNALADSSVFKALVTGGEMSARKLYTDTYNMKANAKIIMLCNELPKTRDLSYGMTRRLLIVDFKGKFVHNNKSIDVNMFEKLQMELSGIFNKALAAYERLVRNKYKFSAFEEMQDRVQKYMDTNKEPWEVFCDEHILENPKGMIRNDEILERFSLWAMEQRLGYKDTLNGVWLNRKITAKYKNEPRRITENGKQVKVREGISWKEETLEQEEKDNGF